VKKILVVLAVLALGTLASAQTFGFGTSIGGSGLYCNYEQLQNAGGGLWGGSDNLVTACGATSNSTISGFNATVPNVGPMAHGPGVVYGDSIYAVFNGDPFAQWTVFTKLKCNKVNKIGKFVGTDGWEGVAAFSGFFAGTNQGPLSCAIPGKHGAVATKGASIHQK
jgi:hypothetical protein